MKHKGKNYVFDVSWVVAPVLTPGEDPPQVNVNKQVLFGTYSFEPMEVRPVQGMPELFGRDGFVLVRGELVAASSTDRDLLIRLAEKAGYKVLDQVGKP